MGVEIIGVVEWKAEAKKIVQQYPEKAENFLVTEAKKLVKMVKAITPVGPTGNLKRRWRRTKPKRKYGAIQVEVKSAAPHAHLIEYGHVIKNRKGGPVLGFVPGRHIFQSSFDRLNAEWDGDLEKWYNDLVKELEV